MVWKLQGSPAPASNTEAGLSTSSQSPTYSPSERPHQPFLGPWSPIPKEHHFQRLQAT